MRCIAFSRTGSVNNIEIISLTQKSTILSILERLYDPISGSITIDGVEISGIDVSSLR